MKYLIPFGLLSIFFYSCRNCEEKGTCDPLYFYFPLEVPKDYMWADTGSYWIYKNDKTGDLDTQLVLFANITWVKRSGSRHATKHRTVEFEYFRKVTYSSFYNWIQSDETPYYDPDYTLTQNNIYRRTISYS